ncbi:SDR family NAD(P)-dependent oxidoreductase [Sphingomonas naphthae]|uniref:SDR family NAD(P)-dependent oxidoreductase n=1 Tax=Sphingomonas naphthae TaxID=1813468 RepID=A0ABY7THP7_9SPHN|nr:SDR family NAD(P)-dependent oxidoreductase [Sphingomonas naphthae]WCT71864.1 SDR family NAD(P)-dependent oxidoreductase [Sphingomonas naphthae]
MNHLLIFGLGYSAQRIARAARGAGWSVIATRRHADANSIAFDDEADVRRAIARSSHILSSVPPDGARDPVLDRYGPELAAFRGWIGYLSSTGVYGDTGGAWVDESAALAGRRGGRIDADRAWGALPAARVFRLPGIYGPGRSVFDRLAEGRAHRIALPDQIFSRIHVDDIAGAVIAATAHGPPGIYNIADDRPAPQNDVVTYAAGLIGIAPPPLRTLAEADLSPAAAAFYAENRRVANGRAKRLLGWRPRFADYRAGLRDLSASTSPISTSAPPAMLSSDQT